MAFRISLSPVATVTVANELPTIQRQGRETAAPAELLEAIQVYNTFMANGDITDGQYLLIASVERKGNGSQSDNKEFFSELARMKRHGTKLGFDFNVRTDPDDTSRYSLYMVKPQEAEAETAEVEDNVTLDSHEDATV